MPDVSRETSAAPLPHLVASCTRLGIDLPVGCAGWLVALLDRIALEPQNLTTIDDPIEAVERHLLDSLCALALPEIAQASRIVDIGSGAGFPGLALAAARPDARVTLVESERRKTDWLARASEDRSNVRVVADRSESFARRERETCDVVTARAVAPLATTLELAAPLVAVGGTVVVWRGPDEAEEAAAADAATALGLGPGRTTVTRPFAGASRRLLSFLKVAPTPDRYPRRPGRANKRPLA
jgi:16S rRNA (guanine527-N7)-methyltransferase